MRIANTPLHNVFLLGPTVFHDDRGYFCATWNQQVFHQLVGLITFVQDNESFSSYGVVRRPHFQSAPHAQVKSVRMTVREIYNVAVDLRPHSPTFGQHYGIKLSGENKQQLFLPQGLAHGFAVLSPQAIASYLCDQFYSPENEGGIHFDDPELQIDWQLPHHHVRLSPKDQQLPSFQSWREKL